MFKELFTEAYNFDIQGDGNRYLNLDKKSLKKKIKSFNTQIADLRNKAQKATFGSGGNREVYFTEIDNLNLSLAQAQYALKGK